jgi:nitronate monooxygenase
LSVTWRSLDEVRQIIRDTKALTDKPFGINLVLKWPQEERLKVCLEEGVKLVSFFWGDPASLIPLVHEAGGLVMHSVGSAEEAKQAVHVGTDIIVAQGWEAGGHVCGKVSTLSLVPSVVDAVSPTPVIAAGGIADGRGVSASLMLGAEAAWLGTRFVASEEANAHSLYKQKILNATDTDTHYGIVFNIGWSNAPHRVLQNSTVEAWESAEDPRKERPNEDQVVAHYGNGDPILRYSDALPLPNITGDVEALALYAGQSVGLIHDLKPAATIVKELVDETVSVMQKGQHFIEEA